MLYSVICVSKSVAPIPAEDLEDLVAQTRQDNRRDAITGMLLYKRGQFMHLIEGVRRKVEDQRQRITLDHRLRDVSTLAMAPIIERQFSAFALGFFNLDALNGEAPTGYEPYLHLDFSDSLFKNDAENARKLLLSFRNWVPNPAPPSASK